MLYYLIMSHGTAAPPAAATRDTIPKVAPGVARVAVGGCGAIE